MSNTKQEKMNDPIIQTHPDIKVEEGRFITSLYHYDNQERSGSTRTKGYINMLDTGTAIQLTLKFNVRKSGYSGTGKGALAFELLDSSFTPLLKFAHGLTVGAKFPEGTNDKDWSKTVTITGKAADKIRQDGLICAASISTLYDNIGLPRDLSEWKKLVQDVAPILALGYGDSLEISAWLFTKIK